MQRAHKIRLDPNNKQATYFAKACGIRRFAYNWGLAEWKRQYESGLKPCAYGVKKQFNSIKHQEFPWVSEVTKCAPEQAFLDLDRAFRNFFRNKKFRYPRFKKKGVRDSFLISNQHFSLAEGKVRIPKLGWVRMRESLRFQGKVLSATVSKEAGHWFIAITVEIPDAPECSDSQVYSAVGVDLGLNKLAVLSTGEAFENPRTTQRFERRLRRLNKSLARKKKGGENWKKAKQRLSLLHFRIRNIRQDSLHKLTSYLANCYSDVCIEDLNASGMVRNKRLAKSVSDAAFREFRRQLEYKAIQVHVVDRFFPSSKLCMECGQVHEMPLSKRIFKCSCNGLAIDRDLHAARNILRQGLPNVKPVEREALAQGLFLSGTAFCEAGNLQKF